MRFSLSILLISLISLSPSALKGQADPWIGVYLNKATGTSLLVKPKADGMYRGEFRYEGMALPIRAINLLGVFTGEYQYQGQWFSFTLTGEQKSFKLSADGVTLQMDRQPPGTEPPPLKTASSAQGGGIATGNAAGAKTGVIEGKDNAAWTQRLKGRQLLFLETLNGGTSKMVLNLFADGRYDFETSSSYASGGYGDFSYADKNGDKGSWRILDRQGMAVLTTVSSRNGERSELRIQPGASAGQVLLNGKRFFIRDIQ
jgi:hypothetical protein